MAPVPVKAGFLVVLVCSIAFSVEAQVQAQIRAPAPAPKNAISPSNSTTASAPATIASALNSPSAQYYSSLFPNAPAPAPGPNSLNVPPASQICPDSLTETLTGQNLVDSPQPFSGVPSSWTQTTAASTLGTSPDNTYVTVTNRQGNGAGVALSVNNMQVGSFYKVGAYIKINGATDQKLRVTFNFNNQDYKCAAIVSVVYSDCYTLVLGGLTGPSQDAPYNTVQMQITGDTLANTTQPSFDMDVYSAAVVGFDRATWLADVQERTDLVRKRDVIVTVKDQNGNPVPNATVTINQLNQTFPFGTDLNDAAYNYSSYRDWFASKWGYGYSWTDFNNALEWYAMQPDELNVTTTAVLNQQNYCNNISVKVRGHAIFWDDEGTQQDWVKLLASTDPAQLYGYMQLRINDVIGLFKNAITQWDPSNELLHKNYYSSVLGFEVRPWYFNRTKQLDPNSLTFLSDYNIVEACDDADSWPEAAKDFIDFLREKGGAVDGFAVQGQFTSVTPYLVRYGLDKLGQYGLPIWMSEVNLRLVDPPYSPQAQQDNFELIVRELYAHPAVDAILLSQTWNPLWDWVNGTCDGDKCLYNYDYTLRPVGQLWESLYYSEWMTKNVVGTTDSNGVFTFRGFAGRYQATVNGTYNSTYSYQSAFQFLVEPLNTTVNFTTYEIETAGAYVDLTNGAVVSNASIPANLTIARETYNISLVEPDGGLTAFGSTLNVSTPFIYLYNGSDNIAASIYHLEKAPTAPNNVSSYQVVQGSVPQLVTIVAPLTPKGNYPVSTIQTFVEPT